MSDLNVPKRYQEYDKRLNLLQKHGADALKSYLHRISGSEQKITEEIVLQAMHHVFENAFTVGIDKVRKALETGPHAPRGDAKRDNPLELNDVAQTVRSRGRPLPKWMHNPEFRAFAERIANSNPNQVDQAITNGFNNIVNKQKNQNKLKNTYKPRPKPGKKLSPSPF